MMLDKNWTATTNAATKAEPLTEQHIKDLLEKVGVPQGIILLPSINGYDVYQFPVDLLKGAMALLQGKPNPLDDKSKARFITDE